MSLPPRSPTPKCGPNKEDERKEFVFCASRKTSLAKTERRLPPSVPTLLPRTTNNPSSALPLLSSQTAGISRIPPPPPPQRPCTYNAAAPSERQGRGGEYMETLVQGAKRREGVERVYRTSHVDDRRELTKSGGSSLGKSAGRMLGMDQSRSSGQKSSFKRRLMKM